MIRTWDHRRVIVLNSIVSTEPIINWTIKEPEVIWPIDIGVAQASDIDRARDILHQEASLHPSVLKDREISILLTDAKDGNYCLRLFARFASRALLTGRAARSGRRPQSSSSSRASPSANERCQMLEKE